MYLLALAALLLRFSESFSKAVAHPTKEASLPLPYRVIHQFANPTWIENIAVRSNGKLLLTDALSPILYHLDPSNPSNAEVLYNFTSYTGVAGITELGHDIFYVVTAKAHLLAGDLGIGTYAIWKIDMNGFDEGHSADVEKFTGIPEAHLLNGMTTFSEFGDCGTVLIADSALGLVFKLDVASRNYSIAVQVPEMAALSSSPLSIGVNGIKLFGEYLYWTNSVLGMFSRIKLGWTAQAVGASETIASNQGFEDDFIFDREGNAWIATDSGNTINVIFRNGTNVTVEGGADQIAVAGSTSCQFGRTLGDLKTLYVATNGGLSNPLPGNVTEGGKVVAIDTSGFI